jgi:protein O-GlcNAc transferase
VAAQIKADGVDILIDLAGHTAHSRLSVFTFKPAPVQATYLGYFTTTGVEAMDYWLSDEVLTPADTVEQSSETIIRLPRCCLVYTAPEEAPAVVERPRGGAPVFGNFNDLSKAGPGSVEAWSEILRRVPESRLLLKAKQLGDGEQREAWWRRFEAEGIERGRIELRTQTKDKGEHLAMYGEVDIALDTMPRTGGATTAEALWMGVPVISLAGKRFIERLSASMLEAAGLDELVAGDVEGYIDRAVGLAGDEARRRDYRAGLRQRLQSSPLCDAAGLAQALEAAYHAMWQHWCEAG